MMEAIFCLAGIAAATGDPARAARLAAAAELHHSRHTPEGITLDDEVRASIETAKVAADPEIWQQAWAAGSGMSLDEAIDHSHSSSRRRTPRCASVRECPSEWKVKRARSGTHFSSCSRRRPPDRLAP